MKTFSYLLGLSCLLSCSMLAGEVKEREVTVSLDAPDTAWTIKIRGVYVVEKEIRVVAELKRPAGVMGGMAITTVSDSVSVALPDLPVKMYVMGKNWNWGEPKGITFVDGWKALEPELDGAEKVWPEG